MFKSLRTYIKRLLKDDDDHTPLTVDAIDAMHRDKCKSVSSVLFRYMVEDYNDTLKGNIISNPYLPHHAHENASKNVN